jgi:hypothetical protein
MARAEPEDCSVAKNGAAITVVMAPHYPIYFRGLLTS